MNDSPETTQALTLAEGQLEKVFKPSVIRNCLAGLIDRSQTMAAYSTQGYRRLSRGFFIQRSSLDLSMATEYAKRYRDLVKKVGEGGVLSEDVKKQVVQYRDGLRGVLDHLYGIRSKLKESTISEAESLSHLFGRIGKILSYHPYEEYQKRRYQSEWIELILSKRSDHRVFKEDVRGIYAAAHDCIDFHDELEQVLIGQILEQEAFKEFKEFYVALFQFRDKILRCLSEVFSCCLVGWPDEEYGANHLFGERDILKKHPYLIRAYYPNFDSRFCRIRQGSIVGIPEEIKELYDLINELSKSLPGDLPRLIEYFAEPISWITILEKIDELLQAHLGPEIAKMLDVTEFEFGPYR